MIFLKWKKTCNLETVASIQAYKKVLTFLITVKTMKEKHFMHKKI